MTIDHPMIKDHDLSFAALVGLDSIQIRKLYPERSPEATFAGAKKSVMYICCNRHGLYEYKV